jgi:uncharacterized membrane protein YbhN (UPF0104 family)
MRRHPAIRFVGSAVFLLALALVLRRGRILQALHAVPPLAVLAAFPFFMGIQLAAAFKWYTIVKQAGAGLSFRDAAQCYFSGLFGNLFLPGVTGGDAVTVTMALIKSRNRTAVVTGSILNRVLDLSVLGILVALAAMLFPEARRAGSVGLVPAIAIVIGVLAAIGAVALIVRTGWIPARWKPAVEQRREALVHLRRPGLLAFPLAMSLGIQLGFLTLTAAVGEACGLHVSAAGWLFAWPVAKLVAMAPISVAGVGVREAALAATLAPFGAPMVRSVAVGLAWELVLTSGALASGAIAKLLSRRSAPVSDDPPREEAVCAGGSIPAARGRFPGDPA